MNAPALAPADDEHPSASELLARASAATTEAELIPVLLACAASGNALLLEAATRAAMRIVPVTVCGVPVVTAAGKERA